VNVRKLRGPLNPSDARDINEAEHFAAKRGKKLNTTVSIHPKLLTERPDDIGLWLSGFLNQLRIWCRRSGFGYFSIWVRENYEGDCREHVHVLLYVPDSWREAFKEAVRRWLHGETKAVHFGEPEIDRTKSGQLANKALTYLLKQMTSQARYSLCNRVYREKKCKETHALVAPVLGKRYGVSRSLNKATRAAFWAKPSHTPIIAPQELGTAQQEALAA